MSRKGRIPALVILIAILIASFSLTVNAATEGEEGGDDGAAATTTTIDSGLSPAVDAATEEPPVVQADWTYRYMVPTGLALAAIVVLITAIKYFTDVVRKRYRIVD